MESIENFIQQVSRGESLEAKESLNNMISAKAFEALSQRKQELASVLFNGKQEESQPEESAEKVETE